MARSTRTFSDIDLNFIANPATGDISKKYDENAIKQAVKTLVLTNHYERLFHPEIGSQVSSLLFEPYNPITKAMLERAIANTIMNHEPRVVLMSITITPTPDTNSLYVAIVFRIVNTTSPITVSVTLQRTR